MTYVRWAGIGPLVPEHAMTLMARQSYSPLRNGPSHFPPLNSRSVHVIARSSWIR